MSSFVNISAARVDDGGLYACAASNGAGSVEHAARLNVIGPPRVRSMAPVRAVAGEALRLDCHYTGHPVDRITWAMGTQTVHGGTSFLIYNTSCGSPAEP